MGQIEKSGPAGSGTVTDKPRVLSGMEKAVIREKAEGADELELRYMLRYVRADLMRDELQRRDDAARAMIEELRDATRSMPSYMDYGEAMQVINRVRDIVRVGGDEYGK